MKRELDNEDREILHGYIEKQLELIIDECQESGESGHALGKQEMFVLQGLLLCLRKLQYISMLDYVGLSASVTRLYSNVTHDEDFSSSYSAILNYFKPESFTENNE